MSGRKYPVAIDLFAGAGGLTLGLRAARFKVVAAVEVDPLAVETYRANFPGIKVWSGDIRDLTVAEVKRVLNLKRGELDLIAGCPPCQGFSTLRSRNGRHRVKDDRNDLVLEFERFVRGLRPKAVLVENVPGLVADRRLRRLERTLGSLGYTVAVRILDASKHGVPQRRRRMILAASRYGAIPPADETPEQVSVRDAIGSLPRPGRSGDELHDLEERRDPRIVRLIARVPKDGGSRRDLGSKAQLECHRRSNGFNDVYGRMAWQHVAPTITSGCVNPSKGRFLHPEQDRAITLREAALLQGFPDDHFFSLRRGKFAAAEMIGNALPPEFVRRQAVKIREHLDGALNRRSGGTHARH